MKGRHHAERQCVAVVTALALVSATVLDAFQAQPAAPAAAKPAAKPAAASPPIDGGWPRSYNMSNGGAIRIYQPQIADWPQQAHMSLYAAVSYSAKGATKPALGTIKAEADTRVAVGERLVNFGSLKITESNFPTLSKDEVRDVVAEIDKAIPDTERVIALDRVLAGVDKSQIMPKNAEGVKADPPAIFFSKTPAILMNFDGDPVWSVIRDNDLKFAVNTNWDVFRHETSNTFYLRNDKTWLKASDLAGPWAPAGKLPESFSKLPADENWKDVRASLPGRSLSAKDMPTVFLSTQPAELILLRGEPNYLVVSKTKLLWVNNTESDVFRMGKGGPVYFLVAGRWFMAKDFTGPWTFTTPDLPEDFKKIPLEHPRSRVLASVPGTQQAAEAVLLAQVPQTARVNKKELKGPEVVYQGDPKFESIEKTSVKRAVNTDKDVIQVGDKYFMCYEGVWFTSGNAKGPWEVASTVPKEIYTIPTSSPAHNVTYVVIQEDKSDDDWVTFAYVAGYTGMMIAWGCAVWGSGWYYPPYVGYGGFYPAYYPYFPTYGYSAYYNPWNGTYGRGAVAYGPYGGVGAGARYNPSTGTYARGAAAWGPYGASGAAQAWNPRTGTYAQTRQGSNVYGSWGSTSVQRGDNWAQTSRVTNRATGTTTRATTGSEGGAAVTRRGPQGSGGVARTGSGDVYAGRDGNVYRKSDGSWQQYNNGNWGAASAPQRGTADSSTYGQLERDRSTRAEGTQRTGDYSNYRSSSGTTRSQSGSYRSGAGGARAGGGRRR